MTEQLCLETETNCEPTAFTRYTFEEDMLIIKLVNEEAFTYEQVGTEVGRTAAAIRSRSRRLREQGYVVDRGVNRVESYENRVNILNTECTSFKQTLAMCLGTIALALTAVVVYPLI